MAKGIYFDKDDNDNIIGYGVHCLLMDVSVIVMTRNESDLEVLLLKTALDPKSKITPVLLSSRAEEKEPDIVYSAGFLDKKTKACISMYDGPVKRIQSLFVEPPHDGLGACIVKHQGKNSDIVYKWHKGKGEWIRVNKDIKVEDPPPWEEKKPHLKEQPQFDPDSDIPF